MQRPAFQNISLPNHTIDDLPKQKLKYFELSREHFLLHQPASTDMGKPLIYLMAATESD